MRVCVKNAAKKHPKTVRFEAVSGAKIGAGNGPELARQIASEGG
jgi:hypothetical protein